MAIVRTTWRVTVRGMNALPLAVSLCLAAAPRDGQRDFDFQLGHWKVAIKRLKNPLTHEAPQWEELSGESAVHTVWGGNAQLEELVVRGRSRPVDGVALRLYLPDTGQWSVHWASARAGRLDPAAVGEFHDGRGELYALDHLGPRAVLVRQVWTATQTQAPHFEQAFSADGGKTWEVNWVADQTRLPDAPADTPAAADASHDFDFEWGHWSMRVRRLEHPLDGSKRWYEFPADSHTVGLLGGLANLEQVHGEMPQGPLDGLTLRLYSPATKQWALYWANRKTGRLEQPMLGGFKDGRGEFYDQEDLGGRAIYVRYVWSNTHGNQPHFEQAFSDDGGKTWEANWVTDQQRAE